MEKLCPEDQALIDMVDGRTVEGLVRGVRRLSQLAERDPLKVDAARKLEVYMTRVKHCRTHSLACLPGLSKEEATAGVDKLVNYNITISSSYYLALLSMALKRLAFEKQHMNVLRRIMPLSNGRPLNPLDVFLSPVDCPIEDKVVLFQQLCSKLVFVPPGFHVHVVQAYFRDLCVIPYDLAVGTTVALSPYAMSAPASEGDV